MLSSFREQSVSSDGYLCLYGSSHSEGLLFKRYSGAGTGYRAIGRLAAGASIQVLGEQRGTDGKTWYQIRFSGTGGTEQTGYVSAEYVRLPVSYTTDSDFEAKLSAEGFPESYKNGLRQLHAQYPNWVFKAKKQGWTGTR